MILAPSVSARRCTEDQSNAVLFRRTGRVHLLVPHLEAVVIADLDVPQAHVFDAWRGRPARQPLDDLLDRGLLAFHMRIDSPVRAITHPAGHSQLRSLLAHPCAEEDALNTSGHADVPSDLSHHTVEISGASSAF